MARPSPSRLEKLLVLLLATSFALPLLTTGGLLATRNRTRATLWLRNKGLRGLNLKPAQIAPSRATILSAKYQTSVAEDYAAHFAGREFFIRSINEIYLRVFRLSTTDVLIGPHFSLLAAPYYQEYCRLRPAPGEQRPLVADLRRMQDFCAARGIPFALVITPSKAALYPENLPFGWRRDYDPRPRYYDDFVTLLDQSGIHYVDGHRLAADLKKASHDPVFPLGGIHWTDPPALQTANALLECLAAQGLRVQPIRDFQVRTTDHPTGQDNDLANLLNTLLPLDAQAPVVTVNPVSSPQQTRPNLVMVGGSFCWKILDLIYASGQLSETEYYFYYKLVHRSKTNGDWHKISAPTQPLDLETDVFAADSLVLEVNEQALSSPTHLASFLHDALAALPDPHAPRAAFHYWGRLTYQWGDPLTFLPSAQHGTMNMAATSGFADPDSRGAYTDGPLATITFTALPAPHDITLSVEASSYLSEQRVNVWVNGHALGQQVWQGQNSTTHELTVPKEYLSPGQVRIEFRLTAPKSPAELGVSTDTRRLGLRVASIRLY